VFAALLGLLDFEIIIKFKITLSILIMSILPGHFFGNNSFTSFGFLVWFLNNKFTFI